MGRSAPKQKGRTMDNQIIIALITAGLPVIATTISSIANRRRTDRHAAKQSIFQMIMEDHIAKQEGRLPTNYQNILNEYDIYHKNGGNSYVTEKVEEYKAWFAKIQAELIDKKH